MFLILKKNFKTIGKRTNKKSPRQATTLDADVTNSPNPLKDQALSCLFYHKKGILTTPRATHDVTDCHRSFSGICNAQNPCPTRVFGHRYTDVTDEPPYIILFSLDESMKNTNLRTLKKNDMCGYKSICNICDNCNKSCVARLFRVTDQPNHL